MKNDYSLLESKEKDIREFLEDIIATTNIISGVDVNVQLNTDTAGACIKVEQLDNNGESINGFELVFTKEWGMEQYVLKMMNTNGGGSFTALDTNRIEYFEIVTVVAKSLVAIEKRLDRTMKEYRK